MSPPALLQGEGKEKHPVEYASRLQLTPAERNYAVTEKEAQVITMSQTGST